MKFELDARRLLCPMPVIKAQNKIKALMVLRAKLKQIQEEER